MVNLKSKSFLYRLNIMLYISQKKDKNHLANYKEIAKNENVKPIKMVLPLRSHLAMSEDTFDCHWARGS